MISILKDTKPNIPTYEAERVDKDPSLLPTAPGVKRRWLAISHVGPRIAIGQLRARYCRSTLYKPAFHKHKRLQQ